jgi:conjugative relaxase-like TrwC/TraI family protein
VGGIRFYDFQCSAQKSLSIMAVTLGDNRLRLAHEKAFETAMKELERFAARRDNSTFGTLKEPITTGNLLASVFHHDASRSLDPQIHTHSVVSNATYDPKTGKILTLQESLMVRAIRYAGKVYQNEAATNVRECGYDIETKTNKKGIIEGYEIVGVPEEIRVRFSKRRTVIDSLIEEFKEKHGRKPTTEEINIITKESRDPKLAEITTKEVIEEQRKQLNPEEMNLLNGLIKKSIVKTRDSNGITLNNKDKMNSTIEYAIGHLYSRSSVLKGNQLLAESLNQGIGYTDLTQLKHQIKESTELLTIKDNKDNYYLGDDITTVTGMQREIWAVEKINQTKNSMNAINPKYKPFSDKKSLDLEASGKRNYIEHRKVLNEILKSRDQFILLRGVAGAGKTTSLTELQKALQGKISKVILTTTEFSKNIKKSEAKKSSKNQKQEYLRYIYLSPTTTGVDALKKEGFDNATTIEKFKLTQNKIDIKNGLIVVDEAGLLSNIDGTEIMKAAEKNNARILFVGDVRQHKSVAAGDFLRILETHSKIQGAELNKVYRQQHEFYNTAATMMASGDVKGGIELMDQHESMGWIKEGRGKYKDNAIKDYLRFTKNGKQLDRCIFISPSNKECNDITLKLRDYLKEKNIIDSQKNFKKETFISNNWTAHQKKSVKNYIPGQTILIRLEHGSFNKNEIVEVKEIIKDRFNHDRVMLTDGRLLSTSTYKNFEVGETDKLELCKNEKIMARMPYNGIANGDIFTVKGIDVHGNITTTKGVVIPKDYKSVKYGYVSTSHKKQGSKADYVVIAAEKLNKDSIYVASTRGVYECRINVPDKEQLYRQAEILTERTAALDLAGKERFINKIKTKDKANIISRERIWDRVIVLGMRLKGKLLKYIKDSKKIDKIRINKAGNQKFNIADPFIELAKQHVAQNKSIDKGIKL